MLRGTPGRKRRHSRVLWTLLASVFVLITLISVAKVRGNRAASGLYDQLRVTQQAIHERAQRQHAQVERARAALPANAGVPKDWVFAKSVERLLAQQRPPGFNAVLEVARILLSGQDPEAPEGPGPHQRPPLSELKNRIEIGRQSGTLTPLEESIDWTHHSREEVLAAVERYLASLPQVAEAEAAYEHGLFVVRPLTPDDSATPYNDFLLADLLECRAVFDARRGDTAKAVRSYANSQGMRSEIARPHGSVGYRNLWTLQLIVDAAWDHTPLTQEQRDTILASLPAPLSPDQILDLVLALIDAERTAKDRQLEDVRKGFAGPFLALYVNYRWNSALSETGPCLQDLRTLLALPPIQAFPAMESLAKRYDDRRDFGLGPGPLVTTSAAARFHIQNLLNSLTPGIAKTVFALKDFKREHGKYPTALDGVDPRTIPPLPTNPLSEQPLAYRSDGKTFAIILPDAAFMKTDSRLHLDRPIASLAAQDGTTRLWKAQ